MTRSSFLPLLAILLVGSLAAAPNPSVSRRSEAAAAVPVIDARPPDEGTRVEAVAFTSDGSRLMTRADNGFVQLWNPFDREGNSFEFSVEATQVSPDGQSFARLIPAEDGRLRVQVLDGAGQVRSQFLTAFEAGLDTYQLGFSPDGETLLLLSLNRGEMQAWNRQGVPVATLQHPGGVNALVWSPDSQSIVTEGLNDNLVRIHSLADGSIEQFVRASGAERDRTDGSLASLVFSPDGQRFVTTEADGILWLRDRSGNRLNRLTDRSRATSLWDVQFSPNGDRILAVGQPHTTVVLWDADGHPIAQLEPDASGIASATFSPDGTKIATVTEGLDRVRVWDLDGNNIAVLPGTGFHWSPDGQFLLTSTQTGSLSLWNAKTQETPTSWRGHRDVVAVGQFSPDGQSIATVSRDGIARLWDLEGRALDHWQLPRDPSSDGGLPFPDRFVDIAFDPQGRQLAVSEADGTIWLLAINPR